MCEWSRDWWVVVVGHSVPSERNGTGRGQTEGSYVGEKTGVKGLKETDVTMT